MDKQVLQKVIDSYATSYHWYRDFLVGTTADDKVFGRLAKRKAILTAYDYGQDFEVAEKMAEIAESSFNQ